MNREMYETITGRSQFLDFRTVRSEGFLSFAHSLGMPRQAPDFDGLDKLTHPASSSFPDRRDLDGSGPGRSGGTWTEDEREVCSVARLAAMTMCSPRPPAELGDRTAALISAAAGRGDEAAVRRLLAAAGDLMVSVHWFRPACLMQALDALDDEPGHSQELACALSCAALWCMFNMCSVKEADRHLGRAWSLSGFSELEDPLLPFAALVRRMTQPLPPPYGPGAEAEKGGAFVNALAVARRLRDPELAAFLPARLLASPHLIHQAGISSMMKKARTMASELPDSAAFRVVWEAARLSPDFNESPSEAGEPAFRALKSLTKSGDIRALAAFDGTAAVPLAQAVSAFGEMLGELEDDGTARAVAFAAPLLAQGQISYGAFSLLFNLARQVNPTEFQGAVMRAVARGSFGTGTVMMLALTNAALVHWEESRRLSSFKSDADTIRRMAGSPDSPGPFAARIAARFFDCELAGRTSRGERKAFAALARLCRSGAGLDGEWETDQPLDAGREKDLLGFGAPRHLALHAYAAALATASWGEDKRTGEAYGDIDRIRDLLQLLPEDAFLDKTFVESILPGACYVAMFPGTFSFGSGGDNGLMAGACSPGPDSPVPWLIQTATLRAVRAWSFLADHRELDPDNFRELYKEALPCLEGPLPRGLRIELVKAVLWGLACMRLPDEMERFFLANSLMLVRDFPEGQEPGDDPLDGEMRDFSCDMASWPAPAEAILCPPAPSSPCGSAGTGEAGAEHSRGPDGPALPDTDAVRSAVAMLADAETLSDVRDDEEEGDLLSPREFVQIRARMAIATEVWLVALARLRAEAGRGDEDYRGWLARYAREFAAERGGTGAEFPSGGRAYDGVSGVADGVFRSGGAGGQAGGPGGPAAGAPGTLPGTGFKTVALGEEDEILFATYTLCLAECGLYERALENLLLDTCPLDFFDIKMEALSRTATGLAKAGKFSEADVALKILEMLAGHGCDPETYERAKASVRACARSWKKEGTARKSAESWKPLTEYEESGKPLARSAESGKPLAKTSESWSPLARSAESGAPFARSAESGSPLARSAESGISVHSAEFTEAVKPGPPVKSKRSGKAKKSRKARKEARNIPVTNNKGGGGKEGKGGGGGRRR
jgi:hypothetical protein